MSSSGQSPRIRRVSFEPTTTPFEERLGGMRCPHCGGTVASGTPAVEFTEAEAPRAEAVAASPELLAQVGVEVAGVLRLMLEVLDGRRPVAQLMALAVPSVLRYVRAARQPGRRVRTSRLPSLRICRPAEHVTEAAAVVGIDGRVRAIAARFEHRQTRWCCVAFRIL